MSGGQDWANSQIETTPAQQIVDAMPKVFCMGCLKWFKDDAGYQNHLSYCEEAWKDVCDYPAIRTEPD